ncbi:nucleotide-diphospho-sugar transferase-domain-containing protein [Pavlovales sp. CCMP2436]|nr:nucleotide-diphospho-sugar transferase-domain-containing protein [Pavlovales sp. CCMP2436]
MKAVIVALMAATVVIAVASMVAMYTSGAVVSVVHYQTSVVNEAVLRAGASSSGASRASSVAVAAGGAGGASAPAGVAGWPGGWRPGECAPELNRQFVESVWSEQHELVVSFSNGNGMDMALNLWKSATAAGVKHMAFGAMDPEGVRLMSAAGMPCFPMRGAAKGGSEAIGWGGAAFKNLGVRKITLLIDLLELGVNVILLDADTVLLKDPLPYLRQWPDADVLASTDHLTNTTADLGLEELDAGHSHWNVGLFYLKASAVHFAHAWRELLIKKPHWWDQHAFGWLLRQGVSGDGKGPGNGGPNGPGWDLKGDKTGLSDRRLFRCFTNHSLVCGTLPVVSFANGHVGLVQRLHAKLERPLYFVHATHQYSAGAGKRHRLREAGVWADPPEYYSPPGGLLYAPMPIPDALLQPRGADGLALFREQKAFLNTTADHAAHPALLAHFALTNYQMRHIRDGVAAAWALGRKLVLPPLACAFDRGPFPHPGKSGGAFEQLLPIYPCPLDYVFDLERRSPGGAATGAPMLLDVAREYSLLNSSRMPRATLDSALRLAKLPVGEGAQALREKWARSSLVELAELPPSFGEGSLLSPAQQRAFKDALTLYTDVWCCINPVKWGLPGHIMYDMLWDVVPHTDRMRRMWKCPWHIAIGAQQPRC